VFTYLKRTVNSGIVQIAGSGCVTGDPEVILSFLELVLKNALVFAERPTSKS